MDEHESHFLALGLALGIGVLIGFERQQSAEDTEKGASFMGGARTYPLVAFSGALCALLGRATGAWFVALGFAGFAAFVALSYADDLRRGRDHGLTSEVAILCTFLLGALAPSDGLFGSTRDKVLLLVSAAIVVSFVLSIKPPLHALANKATKRDVFTTLKFLLVAVVVLPLLPDRAVDPLGALNPYKLGVIVALIAGVGFSGYLAVRLLGARLGLVATGLIGGLASSTAVTLAASARAKEEPKLSPSCTLAIVAANTVMAGRVLVIVGALNANFAWTLAPAIAALVVVGGAATVLRWRSAQSGRGKSVDVRVGNPFELLAALKLAVLITAISFVTKLAAEHLGAGGVYAASVLAGTSDVDAIAVSMTELVRGEGAMRIGATAVLLAIASNTVAKTVIAGVVGGWTFARSLFVPAGAMAGAACAGIAWVWLV